MDCRRIEELIPLYIEGDLDQPSAGRVQTHVRACEACGALVAEYEASQMWLRTHSAPDFDEAFVDGIRREVMRELAEGETALPLVERIKRWLTPRRLATVSAALIVTIIGLALLIYSNGPRRDHQEGQLADTPTAPNVNNQPDKPNAPPRDEPKRARQTPRRTPPRLNPAFASRSRRDGGRTQTEPDKALAQQVRPPAPVDGGGPPTFNQEMLRIEFQTADPNIRIIWLTPQSSDTDAANPMGETR